MKISPNVAGRWEQHGATFAFVPGKLLARNTLYTVTIRRGLPIPGTGMTLEETRVIRFETTGAKVSAVHVTFTRPLFDAAPGERADTRPEPGQRQREHEVAQEGGRQGPPAAGTHGCRRRVAPGGCRARLDGAEQHHAGQDRRLSRRSSKAPCGSATRPTTGGPGSGCPRTLPAGWYVVTVTDAGIARQAILQVTNVAAFSTATGTRSLVWVNDLATNRALSAAQVTMAGKRVGTTDADGLLVTRTPPALLADAEEGVHLRRRRAVPRA